MTQKTLLWFRQDLRLADNAALSAACEKGDILPVYILDDETALDWAMGAASRVWLHHSLVALNEQLDGNLLVLRGKAQDILDQLISRYGINALYWGRCYEPWRITRDSKIKTNLQKRGLNVQSFNNSLLWEPWEINKKDGTPYRVFTPFYRKGCLNAPAPHAPIGMPENLSFIKTDEVSSIDHLNLIAPGFDWYSPMLEHWTISEQGAQDCLDQFLENGLNQYRKGRDFPALKATSRLAPYLHFGQISPHLAWNKVRHLAQIYDIEERNIDHFCSELGWREFSYSLLFHNPDMPQKPLQKKFENFAWAKDHKHLEAWQKGQTGYPIIDAGMRELWQTGYMHNRVRMIVASFLIKNLLIPWQVGERWFWDCLFDADLANNAASWQWVAGCGADAAPYFRIFNPVTQGQKFDPKGTYIRSFMPELKHMPDKYIHTPWEAPNDLIIQTRYNDPIVDLKATRQRALDAYAHLKQNVSFE